MGTSQNKTLFEDYDGFVKKFKPRLTTDDCYTPEPVYNAVVDWAKKYFSLGDRPIVRPFWPGGDYETHHYPERCVVIDNPPFSIFAKIRDYYLKEHIDFLMFAPHLTLITSGRGATRIVSNISVIYANGANVNTSFVTNMLPGVECCIIPELNKAVRAALEPIKPKTRLHYPDNITSSALLGMLADRDIEFFIPSEECIRVSKCGGKDIFGGGLLMSDRLAAEYAEKRQQCEVIKKDLEKQNTINISLSPQEREVVKLLNYGITISH